MSLHFFRNKYRNWYVKIISAARRRTLDGYGEWHHIVPVSMGGPDRSYNFVKLTAREHFVVHRLLPKFVIGKRAYFQMINAITRFLQKNPHQERKFTSHQYKKMREAAAIWGAQPRSTETKRKISEAQKGKIISQEMRDKISATKKGVPADPEVVARRAETNRLNWTPEKRAAFAHMGGKNKKEIILAGVTYPSVRAAKAATGLHHDALMKAIAVENGTWIEPEKKPRKIPDFKGEKNPNYGKTHSEETKAKWSADRKGKYVGKDNPMYGKTHSEEAREKIRQARLGTTQTEESNQKRREACLKAVADGRIKYNPKAAQARRKPVIINGITYGSREEAKKALGVSHTQFFRMIKDGRLKITDAIETKQNPLPNVYGEEVW